MTKFQFTHSGQVDSKTADMASSKTIRAFNANEALEILAREIADEAGWPSIAACRSHLFEHFCAAEV